MVVTGVLPDLPAMEAARVRVPPTSSHLADSVLAVEAVAAVAMTIPMGTAMAMPIARGAVLPDDGSQHVVHSALRDPVRMQQHSGRRRLMRSRFQFFHVALPPTRRGGTRQLMPLRPLLGIPIPRSLGYAR